MTPEQLYANQMRDSANATDNILKLRKGRWINKPTKIVYPENDYNTGSEAKEAKQVGLGGNDLAMILQQYAMPDTGSEVAYAVRAPGSSVDMTKPYTLDGAIQYAIPGAKHGTRGGTDTLITHRTAGHGFHPNDPRLVKDGLGAHVTITRDGKVHQVGSLNDKMWHAGPGYNGRSVGMEVAGKYINGAWEPMTDLQRGAVEKYGRQIIDKYGILPANIRHHASVAAKTAGEGLSVESFLRSLYR